MTEEMRNNNNNNNNNNRISIAPYRRNFRGAKLAMDISSTQSDCQTSDELFSVLFQWRYFAEFQHKHFSVHKNC